MSSIEKAIERKSGKGKLPGASKDSAEDTFSASVGAAQTSPTSENGERFPIRERLQMNGMLMPNHTDSRQVEEYRRIKRPLLSNAKGKNATTINNGNVVMVSSSFSGEGKTFTSINLAVSIAAERDFSVLLIDCDIVRRSLTELFSLEDELGLIDVLDSEDMKLQNVIISTDVPSLSIITAGIKIDNSTELLASEKMSHLMTSLSKQYPDTIIILDCPPILLASQSAVISTHAGQILLVVEEGVTPQRAVLDAISRLDESKVIGTVLNKCSSLNFGGSYGGYYGSYGD